VRLYTISQREEVIVKSEEVLFKLACGRVCSLLIPSYLLTFTSVSLQTNSPLNPNLKSKKRSNMLKINHFIKSSEIEFSPEEFKVKSRIIQPENRQKFCAFFHREFGYVNYLFHFENTAKLLCSPNCRNIFKLQKNLSNEKQ